MSKYDKERGVVGSTPAASSASTSKYQGEREMYQAQATPLSPFQQSALQQEQSDQSQMAEASRSSNLETLKQDTLQQEQDDQSQMATASKYSAERAAQPLPGRDIPVVGPVLSALDTFSENPVVETVADVGRSLYTPGAGVANVAGAYNAVGSGISRIAPNLRSTFGGRVAQEAIKEGIVSAPLAAGQSLSSGSQLDEAAKQAAIGGALGAVGGAALPLIGKGIGAASNAAGKGLVQGVERPSLGAAVDEFTGNVNRSASPTPEIQAGPSYDNVKLTGRNIEEPPSVLRSEPQPNSVEDIITVKEPRIRDRVYNYLDEAEKSAKERISARKGRLNSLPLDEYGDYAIIGAAKIGKGTIKLADFTEEMVKEFGEDIRPKIKGIYNRSVQVAKEAERRASKEAEDARTFNAMDEGDTDTFSGKISRDVKKEKTPFSQRIEKIRTQFVDDLAPLEGLEKDVRGKVNSAEGSLYKSARLYRGMPAKANQIVTERLTPIVKQVEDAGFTSKELGDYALAVHAKDVNARDIKSGFTNREIDSVIQKYGSNPQMEAARKELVKIGDDMLEELSNAGVISKDLVKTLRDRYQNYIPLFRSLEDDKVSFGRGLSDALVNVSSPIKKLKGSERKVIDPLENMVKNIFQSTNAAERNKVALQLSQLAKEDADGAFIRKLDDVEQVGRKNVVSVLEDGEKVRYEVEPEVYKAMLNLDRESSNMLIKVLSKPASLLRAGATLTPEFSLRNPIRDVLQAFVVSKSGFNPIIDFPVGIIQSIQKGDLYKDWVKNMGDFGNVVSMDRDSHKEALEKVLRESVGKKFVNVLSGKQLLSILRSVADTTEAATKVGEYRAALRQGQTPQEAAYRSRDIMDFARSGNSIKQANKVVAFLNANIQGKSKLIRAAKENPMGVGARAFAAITVPTIGVFIAQKYLANDMQKRTIEESPAWLTDSFWLMPIPGTDQVARIPKPFDLAAIFSNAPERALKYVYNNDKDAFDKFASKSLSDMALPAQISGLLPFIEGMANYSFFRQGDIIPQGEQGREFKDQYDINTTETAKGLAAVTNKLTGGEGALKNFSSPRIVDNTIKGLTAGLGTYATSAIDVLLDKSGMTNNPDKPTKDAAQRPLAKAFLVNPLQGGKSTEKIYELKNKLSTEKASAKLNDGKFDKNKDKQLKLLTKFTDDMGDLTKKIRETENSRAFSPEEKRRLIEDYTSKRNDIAYKGIRDSRLQGGR